MFGSRMTGGERYFRGHRRESSFQRGDLKYVILDLLKDKPRHGYEIIREMEELSHGLYKPSPGAVYPTLQMLEEMGYAASVEQDGKKVYTITEEGRQFLVKRKDTADSVRDQIKVRWGFKRIGRMASMMKDYHALERLLSQSVRHLDPEKSERVRQVLVRAYGEIEDILQD